MDVADDSILLTDHNGKPLGSIFRGSPESLGEVQIHGSRADLERAARAAEGNRSGARTTARLLLEIATLRRG